MTERGPETLPTTSLGHYKVRAKIGSGGMGEVFDAVHTGLDKRVAIKTLRKRFLDDDVVVARFLREGQLASRIRHPNIVDVTDVGMMGGIPCLVMEHLEGESFSAMIRRSKRLDVETIVDVLLPIVAAVDFAHEHGIVHRDLKPSNIFLARSWNGEIVPKVLDFGISKLVHESQQAALTTDSAFVGTPHYASPELVRADKLADGRSDQYSMGVILYEAVTGVRPFADLGNNFVALAMAICKGDYPPVRQRCPSVPAAFELVIQRAMAQDAQDRFMTMRALGEALLPFASDRARMIWAPTFEGQGAHVHAPTEMLSRPPPPAPMGVGAAAPILPLPHGAPAAGARAALPQAVPSAAAAQASSADGAASQHSAHPWASLPSGSVPHGALLGHPGYPHLPSAEHPSAGYPSATPSGAADRLPSYGAGTSAVPVAHPRGSGVVTAVIGLTLGVAIVASIIVLRSARHDDASPAASAPTASTAETFSLDLKVTPETALVEIDGVVAGTGRVSKTFPRDGRAHVLRLSAIGYESLLMEFTDSTPPPPAIGLRPTAPPPSTVVTGQGAPNPTSAPAARRSPHVAPALAPAPTGKTKGSSDGRPKTDNIDPWE